MAGFVEMVFLFFNPRGAFEKKKNQAWGTPLFVAHVYVWGSECQHLESDCFSRVPVSVVPATGSSAIAGALEAGVWGSEGESMGKLATGGTRGVLVSCWRTVYVCSCVASERICASVCRGAAALYVQGVWDPELCLKQSHRVIFESRINLVRLAAGWPMWGWRLPWPKSNFTLCPPTCRLSWGQPWQTQQTPETTQVIFNQKRGMWFKPHCNLPEGSHIFAWYKIVNRETNCFGKWCYCMDVSWSELARKKQPHSSEVWVGSSSAHPQLFPPPLFLYCKRQLGSVLKAEKYCEKHYSWNSTCMCLGMRGDVCQCGVVKEASTTFRLRPDLGSAQELVWVFAACFPKLKLKLRKTAWTEGKKKVYSVYLYG